MIVVAYIESFILGFLDINGSGADFNLTTYPLAILLFIFCVKNPNLDSRSRYSEILNLIGRKYSLDIYLYHALIYALLLTFCSQLPFRSFFLNAECVILSCMLLSTILNFKMNFLKGKI